APDVPAPNDGDRVPLALVFADQHGAGLETPAVHLRLVAPCKAVQQLCCVPIKTTEGLLLDVPADKPRHEILCQGSGRGRPERRAPERAKLVEAKGPHAVDLGLDRLATG